MDIKSGKDPGNIEQKMSRTFRERWRTFRKDGVKDIYGKRRTSTIRLENANGMQSIKGQGHIEQT